MNIIFLGYRTWAYKILKNLLEEKNLKCNISACITIPSPEAPFDKLSLPCYTIVPQDLKDEDSYLKIIKNHTPTVFLAYGWSWMLPKVIYKQHTTLILHTSALPKYRGGSPLQNQILAGEKTSAITIFQADGGIDTGPLYAQSAFSLEGHMDEIFERIAKAGTEATIQILNGMAEKKLKPTPQDESKATYFKRRKPEESELKLEDFKRKTSEELYNFIRALEDPYPNAFVICNDGKKLFIKKTTIED